MKHFNKVSVATFLSMFGIATFAASEVPPEQALAVRKVVVAWLECEECVDKELAAVLELGELALPTLGAALERGPSPASLEKYRIHLESTYKKMIEYARTHSEVKIEGTEEEYVKVYLENYQANYAVRSAQALSKLGSPEARRLLDAAGKRKQREDVSVVIQESAKTLGR